MGTSNQRQGVKVKTVREKCVRDSRRQQIVAIVLLLICILVIHATMSRGRVSFILVLLDGMWIAYVLWFVTRNLFHYSFLAEDGVYIVRDGYAVRIPWEMVDRVEMVVNVPWKMIGIVEAALVGPGGSSFAIHFKPGLTDEQTQTPFVPLKGRENSYPFSQKALKIFKAHTSVTVNCGRSS